MKFIRVLSTLSNDVLVVSRSGTSLPRELLGKVHFLSLSKAGGKPPGQRQAIRKLNEILKVHQPKVSVAGPLWPCAYEAAAAKAPKLVATSWAFDVLVDAKRSHRISTAIGSALSSAEVVLFDSPWVCEEAQKLKSFSKSRAKIFPWGVDTERFRPDLTNVLSLQRTFEILHTRKLDKIYRPEVLLRALHLAIQKRPNFRLRITASGPLLLKMQKLSKSLGLEENVEWIPPIENKKLPRILNNTSLYTSAACSDGVSISLLEAMACGLPTVVPDLPSNIHLLSPQHCSQTFRLDDPQSMAQKWIAISELPQKSLSKIREANRAKVERTANLKKFQENYSKIISQLLYDKKQASYLGRRVGGLLT